jgi:hypothetical protein
MTIVFIEWWQVVPIHHPRTGVAGRLDEVPEMLAQLRRATGEVHHGWAMLTDPRPHAAGDAGGHHLGAPRCGVHMAMGTRLVALAPQVDLERLQSAATQFKTVRRESVPKAIHVSEGESVRMVRIFRHQPGEASRLVARRGPAPPPSNLADRGLAWRICKDD